MNESSVLLEDVNQDVIIRTELFVDFAEAAYSTENYRILKSRCNCATILPSSSKKTQRQSISSERFIGRCPFKFSSGHVEKPRAQYRASYQYHTPVTCHAGREVSRCLEVDRDKTCIPNSYDSPLRRSRARLPSHLRQLPGRHSEAIYEFGRLAKTDVFATVGRIARPTATANNLPSRSLAQSQVTVKRGTTR